MWMEWEVLGVSGVENSQVLAYGLVLVGSVCCSIRFMGLSTVGFSPT